MILDPNRPVTVLIALALMLGLASCRSNGPENHAADVSAPPTQATPSQTAPTTPAAPPSPEEEQRRLDAIDNIQLALDEDPEAAAELLGSTPIENLDLESLEKLGERAAQFVTQRMLERDQERREEQARLRDWQNYQNSRP